MIQIRQRMSVKVGGHASGVDSQARKKGKQSEQIGGWNWLTSDLVIRKLQIRVRMLTLMGAYPNGVNTSPQRSLGSMPFLATHGRGWFAEIPGHYRGGKALAVSRDFCKPPAGGLAAWQPLMPMPLVTHLARAYLYQLRDHG